MSLTLNQFQARATKKSTFSPHAGVNKPHLQIVRTRPKFSPVRDHGETAMVARFATGMAILGITPLLLFLVLFYCFPDSLQILQIPMN